MRIVVSVGTSSFSRKIVMCALLASWAATLLQAQDATYPPQKPSSPKIEPQIVVLAESVVQTQWTHTLDLVNAPQNVTLLNPGQCIRVGIYSTGDNRDEYLKKTKLSFRVQFAGHSDVHPFAPLSAFKQIKPEGLDFANQALAVAGVNMPEQIKTMATLGASVDHWCAPVGANDGTVTLEAQVESPSGRQGLSSSTVQIESFETGSKKTFKDGKEYSDFVQTYYRQPNPARLLPALQFMVADQTKNARQGQAEMLAAFVSAAVGSDPVAAKDFQIRLSTQPPLTEALGLLALRSAGCDISDSLKVMSLEDREKFSSIPPLQDPFDLSPTQDLFQHLDMMWVTFGATGQIKPVQTIASMLEWRKDYDDFDKFRKSSEHPSTLTPSIIRGVTYTAAGWSLGSFQRNDPLVADYIEYLLASPDIARAVKMELTGLSTNPAFKQTGGQ